MATNPPHTEPGSTPPPGEWKPTWTDETPTEEYVHPQAPLPLPRYGAPNGQPYVPSPAEIYVPGPPPEKRPFLDRAKRGVLIAAGVLFGGIVATDVLGAWYASRGKENHYAKPKDSEPRTMENVCSDLEDVRSKEIRDAKEDLIVLAPDGVRRIPKSIGVGGGTDDLFTETYKAVMDADGAMIGIVDRVVYTETLTYMRVIPSFSTSRLDLGSRGAEGTVDIAIESAPQQITRGSTEGNVQFSWEPTRPLMEPGTRVAFAFKTTDVPRILRLQAGSAHTFGSRLDRLATAEQFVNNPYEWNGLTALQLEKNMLQLGQQYGWGSATQDELGSKNLPGLQCYAYRADQQDINPSDGDNALEAEALVLDAGL